MSYLDNSPKREYSDPVVGWSPPTRLIPADVLASVLVVERRQRLRLRKTRIGNCTSAAPDADRKACSTDRYQQQVERTAAFGGARSHCPDGTVFPRPPSWSSIARLGSFLAAEEEFHFDAHSHRG